jgi:drug/metabolite transporter (DMT)-like permease
VRLLKRAPKKHEHVSPLDVDYEPPLPPGEKRRTRLILIFILTSVALAAVGQLVLKFGVDQVREHGGVVLREPVTTAIRVAKTPAVWAGLSLFALSAGIWIVVLSRTSLSFAYPFASLTYVLILLFDRFVLDEPVSALRYGGVALIISGLVLISRTGQA